LLGQHPPAAGDSQPVRPGPVDRHPVEPVDPLCDRQQVIHRQVLRAAEHAVGRVEELDGQGGRA
jgi:hypothetical protein